MQYINTVKQLREFLADKPSDMLIVLTDELDAFPATPEIVPLSHFIENNINIDEYDDYDLDTKVLHLR